MAVFSIRKAGAVLAADSTTVAYLSMIPATNRSIRIVEVSNSGRLTSDKGDIGELGIVKFDNEYALRKVGGNLYETDAQPQPVDAATRVQQNMVEASNVQSIFEVSNMIELQRRYQASQKLLEAEHERARTAIQKLTRVN